MKTWMKVVLGIGAALALLIGSIFWLTGDLTDTGDEFFTALRSNDIDAAHAMLSEDFSLGTSKAELSAGLASYGLDKITDISWGGRMKTGVYAEVQGTVTTDKGDEIPVRLAMVEEQSEWRIDAIEKDGPRSRGLAEPREVPPLAEQQRLVRETMAAFAESLAEGRMEKFRNYGGGGYQRQTTVEGLNKTYADSFRFAEGFSQLTTLTPTIEDAAMEEGGLTIRARYATRPLPLNVEAVYEYEGFGWSMLGLVYRVGDAK